MLRRLALTAGLLALCAAACTPAHAQQPAATPEKKTEVDDPKSWSYVHGYGLKLEFHNIGAVLPEHKLSTTMAMFPSGFRADTYSSYTGTYGLGAGWQVG